MAAFLALLKECWSDGHKVALSIFRFLVPILIVVKLLEAKIFIQKYLELVQDAGLSFQEIGALAPDYLEASR